MSFWRTILTLLVAVLLPCAAASAQVVPAPAGKQWVPTFAAEFNAGQSDLNGWSYDLGNGQDGWGNFESQSYTNSTNNVSVSGGALHLTAIGTGSGSNTTYTSGRIRTTNLFTQAYGLFEFRAKLPAGQGLWPAIWMMPKDSAYGGWPRSGEIDILENRGQDTGEVQGTLHSGTGPGTVARLSSSYGPAGFDTTEWHTYALQWTAGPSPSQPGTIRWYVDGNLYQSRTGGWVVPAGATNQDAPFDKPFYLIMNLAVGGNYVGGKRPIMAASVVALLLASCASADPVKVELRNEGGNWQLLRGGRPFFIQGAGGDHSKKVLKDLGGNSFRTWGADNLDAQLDEAQRLGLAVTVGIWLGHERHGFDYSDPKSVREQFERARSVVLKYKDHPAVLMWGVGNEMEGPGGVAGDNPLIWKAVDDIAAMIKREDPNHPPMTVVAEISGPKVAAIHKHCPHVDVIGINSYGGGRSVAQRYRAAGGTKPFVVTEFGPAGMWEVEKTDWGAPIELTSTRKADAYRATYEQTVLAERGKLSLGSYAFIWGHKQEGSATWFGLFLPGGERLEATDTLAELWTGRKVANRCPQIQPLKLETADKLKPGEIVRVSVDVVDPENDPLKIEWSLTKVPDKFITSGDPQKPPPTIPDAVVKNGERTVELKMPTEGGGYWLYCIVRDDHGGAATATLPLRVEASAAGESGVTKVRLPLVLYGDDAQGGLPYVWSGWMGNHAAIAMDDASTDAPHTGKVCMKLEYKGADDFAGIVWQDPPNDWGDKPGGYDLSGAKRLTFWARGAEGGEQVEFKFGIVGSDKRFPDSGSGTTGAVTLKKDWARYSIDLAGRDLSRIKTGFCWSLAGQGKPVTFYLDDVRYE